MMHPQNWIAAVAGNNASGAASDTHTTLGPLPAGWYGITVLGSDYYVAAVEGATCAATTTSGLMGDNDWRYFKSAGTLYVSIECISGGSGTYSLIHYEAY
jgi:hypothetical protein